MEMVNIAIADADAFTKMLEKCRDQVNAGVKNTGPELVKVHASNGIETREMRRKRERAEKKAALKNRTLA